MVYTVELTPEEAQRVEEARQKGLDIDSLFHGLIAALPPAEVKPEISARELFAQWAEEARLRTPEEIAEEDAKEEIYFRNLKESQGEFLLRVPDVGTDD